MYYFKDIAETIGTILVSALDVPYDFYLDAYVNEIFCTLAET